MMDEEKQKQKPEEKNEEKKSETPVENSNEGSKYETTPIIERAREEREKLDAANDRKEELLNREEILMANNHLAGEGEAGQPPVKKEETPAEYTKGVMAGELNG